MLKLALPILLLATATPADFYSKPQTQVALPDGRKVNLACQGSGRPVVVLNAGLGLPSQAWMRVQPALAERYTVCAYDRPGYGFSDPGPMPRTAVRNAEDLYAALTAAHLPAPYVLVGHSRGGYDVREFAARHPKEVAGLVLVDVNSPMSPRLAELTKGPADPCIVATAEGRVVPGSPDFAKCGSPPPGSDVASPVKAKAVLSEFNSLAADAVGMDRIRSYGGMPMIVLTADMAQKGVPAAEAAALQADYVKSQAALADLSRRGEQRVLPGVGHLVMFEKPDEVIRAVGDVVATANTSH